MLFDEERQEGVVTPRWKKPPRRSFLRPNRVTLVVLLVDVIIVILLLHIFEPLITLLRRNQELFGPRLHLAAESSGSESAHGDDVHRIPRILHQTTANETIPTDWVDGQQSCKDVYKDYEYKLWTDASARDFLAEHYSWFIDTWDSYPFPIQRADSIRYFVLHHYGGIYLDMDTFCNATFPLDQIEADGAVHHAVFESTTPTGVTNDFMVSSAKHPALAAAIARLPAFHDITRIWARLQPHSAIMISSGPFFLTLALKNYLLAQPSLPTSAVQVIHPTGLRPYITDLESSSWHRADTQSIMWIGDRPWVWFAMGGVGLVIGLYVLNNLFLCLLRSILGRKSASSESKKYAKLI